MLVRLRQGNGKPPVIFVHGIDGDIFQYGALSALLDADRPTYGLRADNTMDETLEGMALRYIEEIKQAVANGPYLLSGQSFGGTLAYEMARQLTAAGDEVQFLGLLDTWGPDYPKFPSGHVRAMEYVKRFGTLPGDKRKEFLRLRMEAATLRVRRKVGEVSARAFRVWNKPVPDGLWNTEGAHYIRLLRAYRVKAYSGAVTLFRAAEQPVGVVEDPHLGWSRCAEGGVIVLPVPGSHGDLCQKPFIDDVAVQFNAALRTLE
jgi:thioesterase domain-containing protein